MEYPKQDDPAEQVARARAEYGWYLELVVRVDRELAKRFPEDQERARTLLRVLGEMDRMIGEVA